LALDENGYTPLREAADDTYDDHRSLNLAVLDFLLESDEYNRNEKIEAVELAGATILSNPKNTPHFPKAFNYFSCELARLMVNPDEYTIQTLLVKLRIFSSFDGHRHHSLSSSYI